MSARCITWNRKLLRFSPLHKDSFGLTTLQIQGSEVGKMNVQDFFFFFLPGELSTIPGHLRQ